jgi:hypothetical protein
MKKLPIMKCALLNFIISSSIYANENQHVVEYVLRRAYTAIARIEEGTIFLKPEKLFLHQGVVYVEDINGAGFAIPVAFSAMGDPCIPSRQVDDSVIFNSWLCECGSWNHKRDNPTHCWRCDRRR